MSRRRRHIGVAAACLLLAAGCTGSTGEMLAGLDDRKVSVELTDVPFHPQTTDQCGPAALATVLNASGIDVDATSLKPRVYIPGRQGSLQPELKAAARHYERMPYVIDADVDALVAELESGRPVLVLQNLGARALPVWHYAVVVGYDPDERTFVLRSGDRRRHVQSARSFVRAWQRGDYWAIVVLRAGEIPSRATPERFLRTVAELEATGMHDYAINAYRAATKTWPDSALAWLGHGNAAYSTGALDDAASAYRAVLDIEPRHAIAMNNLAQVYLELGCRDYALETIGAALATIDADDPVKPFLQETLQQADGSHPGAACAMSSR